MKASRYFCLFFALVFLVGVAFAQDGAPRKTIDQFGPAIGRKPPQFKIRDQFDREQTLDSLKGQNGTVLVFFRSADW
jgi:hypothetical protein